MSLLVAISVSVPASVAISVVFTSLSAVVAAPVVLVPAVSLVVHSAWVCHRLMGYHMSRVYVDAAVPGVLIQTSVG